MSRRVLSLLLVLAMVLSMVPVVGSADTGDTDWSLSAQVERTDNQVVAHIDYRIPDRTFTAGKSYYFVVAAYDREYRLLDSEYTQKRLYDQEGSLSLSFGNDLPEDCGVEVYLLDEGYVALCYPAPANWIGSGTEDGQDEALNTPEETEPTEITEPTEETEPTEATEATEPTEVTEPTEPTEPTEVTEPTEATEPTEPTEATDSTEAQEPSAGEKTGEEDSLEGYYIAPEGAKLTDAPALENMAVFTGKDKAKKGVHTATFTGLIPGLCYTFIASRSPGSLQKVDLKHITIGYADENGTLSIEYLPKDEEGAIVQLYGYDPFEIWPNCDYFTLRPGESVDLCFLSTAWQKADISIRCEDCPGELTLTRSKESEGHWVITAGEDLDLQGPEIRYVTFRADAMDQQVFMKLRVDLVPEDTEAQSVSLVNTAVTRNLYDDAPTEIPIFLTYRDPEPTTDIQDVQALNAQETKHVPGLIESVRFAEGTDWMIRTFFKVDVQDDHTLLLSTDDYNLQNQADALGSLKSSYSVAFTLRVGDRELTTEPMKLTVQQKKPVVKAQTVTLNSWYQQPKEEILFTGGTVTEIKTVDVGDLPVSLEQKTGEAPRLCLTEPVYKDLSGNVKASFLVEGCNAPVNVTVPVKILSKAPAFKLGKSSVTLNATGYNLVTVPLTCATKGLDLSQMELSDAALLDSTGETPLEGYDINISQDLTELAIRTTGQNRPIGTQNAIVRLGFYTNGTREPGEKIVDLKLKLTVKEPKLKLSTSTVTFNVAPYSAEGDTPVSDKAEVTFDSDLSLGCYNGFLGEGFQGLEYKILNKAKEDCTDLFAVNLVYDGKMGNIGITPDLARVDPKDTYTLTLGVPGGKSPAKVTLKFSSAAPAVTMKAQGKLDSFELTDKGCVMLTFSFKNMGSGYEYLKDTMEQGPDLTLYDSKGRELDEDLWDWVRWGDNNVLLSPNEGVIPAGKYKAVMTFGYWNGKPITATTTVTAVQTPTTAKLSKSSVTLHPLGDVLELTATPSRVPEKPEDWPVTRLEYYRADGKTLWEDQDLIYADLDLENSCLIVIPTGTVPEKDTTVKVKIIPETKAEKKFLWLTVKVLGTKSVYTLQKLTPKVSGTLDPARQWNELTFTAKPKGRDSTNDVEYNSTWVLERSQDKGKTWQKVNMPSMGDERDWQYTLAFLNYGDALDPSCKYRIRLEQCIGNATGNPVLSITAAVKCAYGSNKFTVEDPPTLYKLDPWADLDFRLKAKDASQIIDHIRLKGNPPFEIDGSGENWTLWYTGEDPDSLKTTTLTLEIFLKGNQGTKPNATVKMKLAVK